MSSPRWYGLTVLALLASGGLAFVASGRTWVSVTIGSAGGPGGTVDLTGRDVAAASAALAVVVVASALAVLAAGGWFRRALGLFVVVVALGGVVATFTDSGDAVDRAVAESVAFSSGDPVVTEGSPWPWVALAAFVAAGLLGLVVARYGAAWPTMGRRYEAPTGGSGPAEADPEEADLWSALDHGIDPTDPDATR